MKKKAILLIGFLLPGAFPLLLAQVSDLHVITKRLEKEFNYKVGYEVNIEGEKAEVLIETWDEPSISVVLELTARHPDKAVAEQDLERIRYLAERIKNKIYLRNYISEEEGEAPTQSNLQARYTIRVPADCPVYLKNYFGVATVSNLTNRFRFFGEFSPLGLENVQGEIDLRTRFGDVDGKTLDGNVSISARRSDITLEDIAGRYNIEAQYSIIRILSATGLLGLDIDAEKSDVYLYGQELKDYGYSLTAQYGQAYYPGALQAELLSNTEALKKVRVKPRQEYYPNITISVTFGEIHLEKEKP